MRLSPQRATIEPSNFGAKTVKSSELLAGHSGAVWDIDFSPDGTFIASVGAGNAVKLWQPKNIFLLPLLGHDAAVYAAAFAPDGKIVATASIDGTVKLWRVRWHVAQDA